MLLKKQMTIPPNQLNKYTNVAFSFDVIRGRDRHRPECVLSTAVICLALLSGRGSQLLK